MQIRIQVVRGALVARPVGELTHATANELWQEIEKELGSQKRDIVLDLQSVDIVEIDALAYVFRIQQRAKRDGHRLCVASVPQSAQRLFECTNVAARLEFAPTVEDALGAAPVA